MGGLAAPQARVQQVAQSVAQAPRAHPTTGVSCGAASLQPRRAGNGSLKAHHFSNQYSPSVFTPLSPLLKSVVPAPRKVPRIVLNFPVPPVSVVTVV